MQIIVNKQLKNKFNNKTQIFPIKNVVDFLGFHFYLANSGKSASVRMKIDAQILLACHCARGKTCVII